MDSYKVLSIFIKLGFHLLVWLKQESEPCLIQFISQEKKTHDDHFFYIPLEGV